MVNCFDFTNKAYLVTGASFGLGREVAKCLANKNAILFLTGNNAEQLGKTMSMLKGERHYCIVKDLIDEDYTDLFEFVHDEDMKLDGIVHCDGIAPIIPLPLVTKERIEESMCSYFYSFIELMRLYSKKKYRRDGGSVVTLSSISSVYPDKCQTICAAANAAINTAVQTLALELAKHNVRINAVLHGYMNMQTTIEASEERKDDNIRVKSSEQILGLTEPEDVANVVSFLLSEMSNAITGRTIFADGGYIKF